MLNGLSIHLKTSGADNLSDGSNYHVAIHARNWQDYSGGPWGQIALTANDNMWFRTSSSGTAWKSWKMTYNTGNITCGTGSASIAVEKGIYIKY